MKNMTSYTNKAKSLASNANAKLNALALTATAAALPFAASAQAFDGASIVTKIETYVAVGVVILTAFVIGRWTLKAFGVIGGK